MEPPSSVVEGEPGSGEETAPPGMYVQPTGVSLLIYHWSLFLSANVSEAATGEKEEVQAMDTSETASSPPEEVKEKVPSSVVNGNSHML